MFLDAPKHLSPSAEYLFGLLGALVGYVPLLGLLFIWLFNSIASTAKRPRLAVVVICLCVSALCIFLGVISNDPLFDVPPQIAAGIWLVIGLVFWGGKKEDTLPSPPERTRETAGRAIYKRGYRKE
jgi:predicted membrane channel-forming protein YqfA (hemolysin III family)